MKPMDWWQSVENVRTVGDVPGVTSITHDSRRVVPGGAFAAIAGGRADGHDFIARAVEAQAGAVVVQADRESKWAPFVGRVPLVVVQDTRRAIGTLAAAVYAEPSKHLMLIGVTGTDGKTTSAHLTAHVLDSLAIAGASKGSSQVQPGCGYLTSVAFDYGDGLKMNASHMTTVESTDIQSMLAQAVAHGRGAMVVESSSEGLAQGRLEGCIFDVALFTNLTRDHLDFHGTMEAYRDAKGTLFEMLDRPNDKPWRRTAIVNADDEASPYLAARSKTARQLTYGIDHEAGFRALDVRADGYDMRFRLQAEGAAYEAMVPLIGRFNVLNALAAVATARSQDANIEDAIEALATFTGVPGRLEVIDAGQPFRVYVDIASTPAAMENVLTALKSATKRRLWVVFGAAGGRDPNRRTGIGAVAARLADRIVLTSEDPRDEDPQAIIDAIAGALRDGGRAEGADYVGRVDRREAIAYAFEHAQAGDTVLLAGKATEATMTIRGQDLPWDERAIARELLTGR
jgi:UDP-N-acetylmuramoyl-L-alanyl-D-glutamate--2,6-diaminopimelate ligase